MGEADGSLKVPTRVHEAGHPVASPKALLVAAPGALLGFLLPCLDPVFHVLLLEQMYLNHSGFQLCMCLYVLGDKEKDNDMFI